MSRSGAIDPQYIAARRVLLDALEALREHASAVIVVGAQAVYLHAGDISIAVAEMTRDGDVALDPRELADEPLLEAAMSRAGFVRNVRTGNPGSWVDAEGLEVDVMVPEALAGAGRRSVRIPPHDKRSARRTRGLEAAMVDHSEHELAALDPDDGRVLRASVAGPAALIVAKMHKIGDRRGTTRRADKDAHDVYRLLVATDVSELASTWRRLLGDPIAGEATQEALAMLREVFSEDGQRGRR